MKVDLTFEELHNTIKSKAMKDMVPGWVGIPYLVYNKLHEHAGPLKGKILVVVLLRALHFYPLYLCRQGYSPSGEVISDTTAQLNI